MKTAQKFILTEFLNAFRICLTSYYIALSFISAKSSVLFVGLGRQANKIKNAAKLSGKKMCRKTKVFSEAFVWLLVVLKKQSEIVLLHTKLYYHFIITWRLKTASKLGGADFEKVLRKF